MNTRTGIVCLHNMRRAMPARGYHNSRVLVAKRPVLEFQDNFLEFQESCGPVCTNGISGNKVVSTESRARCRDLHIGVGKSWF